MFFDIHSHILPSVDDGAADLTESLALLREMQSQGITAVIATPHFYPTEDNLNDFSEITRHAFALLRGETEKSGLPQIYLGCEMLYFPGMGLSESLGQLCLNGSSFLLLELSDGCIEEKLFEDISNMLSSGIIPIIAHIERYYRAKNYSRLLKFVLKNGITAQVNSSSFFVPAYKRTLKRLIKSGVSLALATDTHSLDRRPPTLSAALTVIGEKYGEACAEGFIKRSKALYGKIVLKDGNV